MKAKRYSRERLVKEVNKAMKGMGFAEPLTSLSKRLADVVSIFCCCFMNISFKYFIRHNFVMTDKNKRILSHVKEWQKDPEFRKGIKEFIKKTTS